MPLLISLPHVPFLQILLAQVSLCLLLNPHTVSLGLILHRLDIFPIHLIHQGKILQRERTSRLLFVQRQ